MDKTDKQLVRKLLVVVGMLIEETKRDYLRNEAQRLIKALEKRLED